MRNTRTASFKQDSLNYNPQSICLFTDCLNFNFIDIYINFIWF